MASDRPKRRRLLPLTLITVGSVLALLAIFAIWANRQLLDTDNWTDTSTQLLEDDEIRGQLSIYLIDQLYENVDVQAELADTLPPRLQPLAGPAAGAFQDLGVRGVDRLLERPRAQELWEQANRRAHRRLLQVVEDGGGDNVSTTGGDVTLDLKGLLEQTQAQFGVGGRLAERLPADAAQLTILHSDELELAQDGVSFLKALAIILVILALGLMALGVYLARGWRREALRAAGFGLILAGAAALVARSLAGRGCGRTREDRLCRARARGHLVHLDLTARRGRLRHAPVRDRGRVRRLARRPNRLGHVHSPRAGPLPARASIRVRRARPDRPPAGRVGAHSGLPQACSGADPDCAHGGWR